MKKQGFTLAEVLITLAIIGVVAAVSIPSVVANTQQKEFQTGLRKAVSVLNSAITMNMALDGESPYENKSLYEYLGRHMSIIQSMVLAPAAKGDNWANLSFYTTDGMRFEFPYVNHPSANKLKLHENNEIGLRPPIDNWLLSANGTPSYFTHGCASNKRCAMCGSYGLTNNVDDTIYPPCLVVVDVNGDRKPFPQNASCKSTSSGGAAPACAQQNIRKWGDPNGTKLSDVFSIMITDKQAVPFGVVAQKAMYQAQSREK